VHAAPACACVAGYRCGLSGAEAYPTFYHYQWSAGRFLIQPLAEDARIRPAQLHLSLPMRSAAVLLDLRKPKKAADSADATTSHRETFPTDGKSVAFMVQLRQIPEVPECALLRAQAYTRI
jgi:hypothetical protein